MNQKRKAELQRKLSMMPVPRPPAGLADRIKAEIPDDLAAVAGRTPRAFGLRMAASILIVLASTAIAALYLLGGREAKTPFAAPRSAAVPVLAQPKSAPEAELTVSVAEPQSMPAASAKPQTVIAEARRSDARPARVERRAVESKKEQYAPTMVADDARAAETENRIAAPTAPASSAAAGRATSESITVTGAAPVAVAEAPAPTPAVITQQTEIAARDRASAGIRGGLGAMASKTTALRSTADQAPREMFGISIDPGALGRVQKTIESGKRPAAAAVDVEAIVSYLASAPASAGSGVSFDVEGSREPEVVNSRSAMIRFTIDTAPAPAKGRWVGSDAKLEIRLDPSAVSSHRILGSGKPLTMSEPLLFDSASVTGVIEVALNAGLPPYHEVATFKLRYRDANHHSQMIQRIVRIADLQRSWEMASFRHRLATLGAIWSESIRGGPAPAPAEVARTAEELASEAPRDTRARDLADVANAASRLDGSGSSGSGSK